MNWSNLHLFGRGWAEHKFGTLVNRNIRERHREALRFAEQRTTKHQLQAIKSCVADARSYRVARNLSALVIAHFD